MKLIILESLLPTETQTGKELECRINQWAQTNGVNCLAVTIPVHSMQEWDTAWNDIYMGITQMNDFPIIHLEMHGDRTHIGIDKGLKGEISLQDVFRKVQHANILSHNNTFLSLAVCKGLHVIRSLGVYEPMPFCGVIGSEETLENQELLENYTIFYKAFLKTLDLDAADAAMKAAGVEADKYKLVKSEQVFMCAYLGYLESYNTDEKIEKRVLDLAKENHIQFTDDDEKRRWIRDCRCDMLMTEDREYQRAVNQFFMFDRYPEIRERFVTPSSICEFRKLAASFGGNEWVNIKRPLTTDDIKGVALRILHEVDDFCGKRGISYSLAYGTLLGAVRHKGYIPWDDDVDILMTRPNYERFIAEFPSSEESLFSVASPETDKGFHYAFAKVVCNATVHEELGYDKYGLAIDVFPIDKIPVNRHQAIKLLKSQHLIWNIFMLKAMKWDSRRGLLKNLIMCLAKTVCCFIPYSALHRRIRKRIDKNGTLHDYNMGCLFSPYGEREIMPKSIFEELGTLEFEGGHYRCLKDYDRFLTAIYGDYMQFPPVEERVSHHSFSAWWK